MRVKAAICALLVIGSASQADAARKPSNVSWGKPGVSFEDYRRDTLECANKTYGLDVSMRPETVTALGTLNGASLVGFITGLNRSFSSGSSYVDGIAGYHSAIAAIDPGRVLFRNSSYTDLFRHAAYYDVTDQLQAVLDFCLTSRGYHKIRLTSDQRQELQHYPKGTERRARFLHALSSGIDAGGSSGEGPATGGA